jgi:hypothetical protein
LELYLVKGFYFKNVVFCDFSTRMSELPPVCGGVFVDSGRLGVLYDFQVTSRSAVEKGGSYRESSLLPIGRLGVI